jgi:hypothetical protein
VFGFIIESDNHVSGLEPADAGDRVDWRIRMAGEERAGSAGTSLGTDCVYGDVFVRTYASETTLRIAFDDTGVFDVRPSHREIVWYPGPLRTEAAVRADVLGRVMAFAAHADGMWLHATAVCGGAAIALVG